MFRMHLLIILINCFFRVSTAIFIGFIGYSRIYFGLHSIIQVLLGWIYGVYFLFVFYLILTGDFIQFKIIQLFEKLSSKNIGENNQIKTRRTLVFSNTILYLISFIIPWIIFYSNQISFIVPLDWKRNIENKCKLKIEDEIFFYENCFSDVGSVSIIFGGIYGIAFSNANYKHLKFWKNYSRSSFLTKFSRLVFYVLIAGLVYGIFMIFPTPDNPYINCFLENNIKAGFVGFLIIYLLPKIFNYFKLDLNGDFMKEKIVN
jgi:hypothetical protein